MSNTSFVANVNTLAQNISLIKDLSKSLTDTNVMILQKLLDEINLIPIIEDLEKGTFNGNRQIKINLIKNYFGYDKDMTEEELNSLYLDVSNAPEYSGVKLYLDDRSILELPFIQDGTAYNITTNVELYEFLMNNDDVVSRLTNTSFYMIPAQVVGTELVIADVANQLSNLLQIELVSADNKSLEENPIYDWVEYTSALMILSQYFSAIQYLAYQIEDVLAVPEEAERILAELNESQSSALSELAYKTQQAIDAVLKESEQAQEIVDSILYKIADPETALVGQVLTVELVGGVKRVVYKSVADITGYLVQPATTTSNGLVSVGDGLSVDESGRLSAKGATDTVAGISRISESLTSTDINVALSSKGAKALKDSLDNLGIKITDVENIANNKWESETASTSRFGIVMLATAEEVTTGTDSSKAITPKDSKLLSSIPKDLLYFIPQPFSGTFSNKNPVGKSGTIFTDWQICDGTNGTPDLRNRFIKAGTGTNQWVTGGSSTHMHASSGDTTSVAPALFGSIGSTVLSIAQMPSHNHTASIRVAGGSFGTEIGSPHGPATTSIVTTSSVGSSQAHSHSLSGSVATHAHNFSNIPTTTVNNEPPYYTLAYIMYTGA